LQGQVVMDAEIERRRSLCQAAQQPDWDDVVLLARDISDEVRAYLDAHPPGLVRALWTHFDATREHCGCLLPTHERPECQVRLVERLPIDQESQ
jgi:hypothetical protein